MEMGLEMEREDKKVVRRERLHERSSAVDDGREKQTEEGRVEEGRGFGCADGRVWVRQGWQAVRYTTTDVEVKRLEVS